MKKMFKAILKNDKYLNYFMAFWHLVAGAVVTFFLGGILALCGTPDFWLTIKMIFWWFTAPAAVASIILLLNMLPVDLAYGFGCAIYYGTAGIWGLLPKIGIYGEDGSMLACSALITCLICYIVYIKKFKDEHKETDKIDENSREYQVGYQVGYDHGERDGMRFQAMLDNANSKSAPVKTEADDL